MEIGNKYDNVVDFEKKEDVANAIDSNSSISSMYANDSSNEKNLLDNVIDKGFDKLDDKINDFVDKVADAMKADSKEEIKADSKEEIKADSKEEIKADSKEEIKADSKEEVKADEIKFDNFISQQDNKQDLDKNNDYKELDNAIKDVKEEFKNFEVTDEMRTEQKQREENTRDAMSNFNNADSDLAQANKDISDAKKDASSDSAHDIKEEYAKDKIDDFAKNGLGITDDKTREEFVNFTYENNKELIQGSNSLESLDNNITKAEVNAKEDFANNLDRKEEALNGLKDDKDVDKDALNKELNNVKDMKDNLDSDKEKNSDKDVEKDSDKSSEKGADKEKSQDADIAMSR
jgi:hypothetical protein